MKTKLIAAGGSGEISFDEDATYYIRPFYTVPIVDGVISTDKVPGKVVEPFGAAAILALGNTVTAKIDEPDIIKD